MSCNLRYRLSSILVFYTALLAGDCLNLLNFSKAELLAAEKNPLAKKAIQQGAMFIKQEIAKTKSEEKSLAAYALLKAGEPADGKIITGVIDLILEKIENGKYQPSIGNHRHYEAALNVMLLVDATKDKHLMEVRAISDYLIEEQLEDGSWDYRSKSFGDTSVTQYAILGLWAAKRIGVEISQDVWDKAAKWHTIKQQTNGGFAYNPDIKRSTGNPPTLNMSAAGTGTMLVVRAMLYPDKPGWGHPKGGGKKTKKKFGFLKKINTTNTDKKKTKRGSNNNKSPNTSSGSLDTSIKKGLRWMDIQFRPRNIVKFPHFPMYYYYALERMTALAGTEKIQDRDWFTVCVGEAIKMQKKDGSWTSYSGDVVGTSFAILFLTHSTAKLLGHPVGNLGGGLLAGGRGLPNNLSDVRMKGGKVETKKSKDPLSKLLEDLEKLGTGFDEGIQKSVVEKIQVGDPEKLIGERKRLVKLVGNKNPEIRKVAFWALGRGGNLSDARLMVVALKEEDNVDVLIEARNALCFMSHKANGFGLASSPFTGISEDATQQQKDRAMAKWKEEAYRKWVKWYLEVRPYDEKNDLLEMSIP